MDSGWTTTSQNSKMDQEEKESIKTPPKEKRRKARGDCVVSASTSHTQYWRKDMYARDEFKRITTNEFCGLTADSVSGSSDTFQCVHGPEGKQYTTRGLLKRNLQKNLYPIPRDPTLTKDCPPALGWDIAEKIKFLVTDPACESQIDRLQEYLRDFAKIASKGYRIDTLDSLCAIFDYLVESISKKKPYYRDGFIELLKNVEKPILLTVSSDVMTYFESLRNFIGYLGYLLLPLEDDDLFELVSKGLLYQLSASDKQRGNKSAQQRHTLAAARHVLSHSVVRMIATAKPFRFPTFIKIAFLLACDSKDNCLDFMMENIFENIFYRFNPYFPDRELPIYDINPYLDDIHLKLGESSNNMQTVLSVLLVLVKTMKQFLDENTSYHRIFPYPDEYSQRCFVWAYRYECRAMEHRHQRSTLTVIAQMLIHMFGDHLTVFSNVLMPDVLTLSVKTEMPPNDNWTRTVIFNTSQEDVQFKKYLIYLSVDFLKVYPINRFMAVSQNWVVGLMYLVDPGLYSIKAKWTAALYAELRKTALQALMCSIDLIPSDIPTQISLIRRIMWYIEWYSESPYEMSLLYWAVKLLYTSLHERSSPNRRPATRELLHTHGVIIIMNLCDTLVDQKLPPLDKSQSIIALNLRLLTSCLEYNARVSCFVYPSLKFPTSINQLVRKMMSIVLFCMEKRTVLSDRWLLSLMNLIWEAIIWKKSNRDIFIANNGIFQLLDIISMSRYPVQCLTLALICDVMREGGAVAQLVTWRASKHVSNVQPLLVNPGATIASLLAALFRRDCIFHNVQLDESNIIQDLQFPLMSAEYKKYMFSPEFMELRNQRTPVCLSASEVAGSRMAKCYAILQMLSDDLKEKVHLADNAYNLYKNINLQEKDETMLVLVSHYLTIKLNETWLEAEVLCHGLVPADTQIMNEFLHIGRGWAKSIQEQQMKVVQKFKEMQESEENNLYSFLERARLNTALDALREVKCIARTTDRARITHALISDAVRAYHRRSVFANKLSAPVVQTYKPPLDDYNMIGQNIKLINILPKHKPKKRDLYLVSDSATPPASQDICAAHSAPGSQSVCECQVASGSQTSGGSQASHGAQRLHESQQSDGSNAS